MKKTITIKGELLQAGHDENGQPRMFIHTTVNELRAKPLPFYRPAEITFTWDDGKPDPDV